MTHTQMQCDDVNGPKDLSMAQLRIALLLPALPTCSEQLSSLKYGLSGLLQHNNDKCTAGSHVEQQQRRGVLWNSAAALSRGRHPAQPSVLARPTALQQPDQSRR